MIEVAASLVCGCGGHHILNPSPHSLGWPDSDVMDMGFDLCRDNQSSRALPTTQVAISERLAIFRYVRSNFRGQQCHQRDIPRSVGMQRTDCVFDAG